MVEKHEIRDATPCWAKLEWANDQISKLENEISRRDAILDWILKNSPKTLELCPWKMRP